MVVGLARISVGAWRNFCSQAHRNATARFGGVARFGFFMKLSGGTKRANSVRPYRFIAVGGVFQSFFYSIFKLQTRCRKCFSVRSEPLIVFTLLTLTECFLIHCYLAGYSIWDNILILIPKITTFVA